MRQLSPGPWSLQTRSLHLSPSSPDQSKRSFVDSTREDDCLQYEASKKVVRPLYRAVLHAVRDLNDEFHRFGNKDLLTASELAWVQDNCPGAVAGIRQGAGAVLEDLVQQAFRDSLPSAETTDYTQLTHELGSRLDCGFQALSLITKRVGLLRMHAAEPASDCATHGVRVSVNSWFSTAEKRIGSIYHYRIKVRNESNPEPVQLISRHWYITDYDGRTQEVIGPGVIGQQPVLEPGDEYEYSSFTPLMSKRGTQQGTYSMLALHSQELFDVKIAPFALIPAYRGEN